VKDFVLRLHNILQIWTKRLILVMLYYAMNGEAWNTDTGWLSSSLPVSDWYGITFNADGLISGIDLGKTFER
jgi:hypothetical protein